MKRKFLIQSSNNYKVAFKIKDPKLWWPNGEGDQNLYLLNVKIVEIKI